MRRGSVGSGGSARASSGVHSSLERRPGVAAGLRAARRRGGAGRARGRRSRSSTRGRRARLRTAPRPRAETMYTRRVERPCWLGSAVIWSMSVSVSAERRRGRARGRRRSLCRHSAIALVCQQRAALLGGEVAEELGDEHQPQRVVARAPRVLVQPRARGGRGGQLPALLDDQLRTSPGPRARVVQLALRRAGGACAARAFDVVDDREHHRAARAGRTGR